MTDNSENSTTSPSLLLRIRNPNDVQSWEMFQAVYRSMIFAYCLKRGLQEADALDVVQEVMSTVCRAIQTFEYQPEKGRFRAWLGTVTSNKIKTFKRKQHNEFSLDGMDSDEHAPITPFADPDSDWVSIFSEHIFQTACERVKLQVEPPTWNCFQLTWINNLQASDVATQLDVPIHRVYVNKSRVLKLLEKEVLLLAEDCLIERPKLLENGQVSTSDS